MSAILESPRRLMRRARGAALSRVPVALWKRLAPRRPVALAYHVVSDDDLPHVMHYPYKSAAQFEADVVWAGAHLGFVGYEEASRRGKGGRPAEGCLFTFDDGFAECESVIRPILARRGAGGVFFVTAELIDNRKPFFESRVSLCVRRILELDRDAVAEVGRRLEVEGWLAARENGARRERARGRLGRGRIPVPDSPERRSVLLWLLARERQDEREMDRACELLEVDAAAWVLGRRPYLSADQLRGLTDDGFTVGGHGVDHRRLQELSPAEREREIVASCDAIRQITGQARVPFAFPYDGAGIPRTELGEVRRRNPFVGLFFDTGGLRRGPRGLVHRVTADRPPGEGVPSNLPELLRRAWAASLGSAGPR